MDTKNKCQNSQISLSLSLSLSNITIFTNLIASIKNLVILLWIDTLQVQVGAFLTSDILHWALNAVQSGQGLARAYIYIYIYASLDYFDDNPLSIPKFLRLRHCCCCCCFIGDICGVIDWPKLLLWLIPMKKNM